LKKLLSIIIISKMDGGAILGINMQKKLLLIELNSVVTY
jgi:hypothetical protein